MSIKDTVHCGNCGMDYDNCTCNDWTPVYGQEIVSDNKMDEIIQKEKKVVEGLRTKGFPTVSQPSPSLEEEAKEYAKMQCNINDKSEVRLSGKQLKELCIKDFLAGSKHTQGEAIPSQPGKSVLEAAKDYADDKYGFPEIQLDIKKQELWGLVYDAFIAGATHSAGSEAVEFAEWCSRYYFRFPDEKEWHSMDDYRDGYKKERPFTGQQLYDIFKSIKQQRK